MIQQFLSVHLKYHEFINFPRNNMSSSWELVAAWKTVPSLVVQGNATGLHGILTQNGQEKDFKKAIDKTLM